MVLAGDRTYRQNVLLKGSAMEGELLLYLFVMMGKAVMASITVTIIVLIEMEV